MDSCDGGPENPEEDGPRVEREVTDGEIKNVDDRGDGDGIVVPVVSTDLRPFPLTEDDVVLVCPSLSSLCELILNRERERDRALECVCECES